ncbi:hypothetical protein D3C75_1073050 [compost metagenome]
MKSVHARAGDNRTGQGADQRMGGGRRNTEVPGNQVPGNRRYQRCGNDLHAVIDVKRVGNAAAYIFGDTIKQNRADKVEDSRHQNGRSRRKGFGGNSSSDRVGRIMKTVDEVEQQGQGNNNNDECHEKSP